MVVMRKYGTAHWEGAVNTGTGTVSSESGALKKQRYGFNARFEGGPGTNPEELLAAAHAGCFAMSLANELGKAGFTPTALDTRATVSLSKDGDGFSVTGVHLVVDGAAPGADEETFRKLAQVAEKSCPVSKLFNTEITLDVNFRS